jgi:hypothetical protein
MSWYRSCLIVAVLGAYPSTHAETIHVDDVSHCLDKAAYLAGDRPFSVAIGDLDGVNGNDLVVANEDSHDVWVLLNQGGGTFGDAVAYSAGVGPRSVAIGDLDGINGPDLAVTYVETSPAGVSVLLNRGDGTFAESVAYPTGDGAPRSVAIGDLDGINGPDLAVANLGSDDISVLLNQGNGTFAPPVTFSAGDGPVSMAIADVDGIDGLDLAVTWTGSTAPILPWRTGTAAMSRSC